MRGKERNREKEEKEEKEEEKESLKRKRQDEEEQQETNNKRRRKEGKREKEGGEKEKQPSLPKQKRKQGLVQEEEGAVVEDVLWSIEDPNYESIDLSGCNPSRYEEGKLGSWFSVFNQQEAFPLTSRAPKPSLKIPCVLKGVKATVSVMIRMRGPCKLLPEKMYKPSLKLQSRSHHPCPLMDSTERNDWIPIEENPSSVLYKKCPSFTLQDKKSQCYLPYSVVLDDFTTSPSFTEFRLEEVKVFTIVKPDVLPSPYNDLLISPFLLPPGSKIRHKKMNAIFSFEGHLLEHLSDDHPAKVAVLRSCDTGDLSVEILDPFKYEYVSPPTKVERVSKDKFPWEYERLDKLAARCGRQKIRGVPLIDLLRYLTSEMGLFVCIVGGAVRDILRGIDPQKISDIDIAVGKCDYFSLQRHLLDFFASRGLAVNDAIVRAKGTSKEFGMLKVIRDPATDDDDLDIGLMKANLVKLCDPTGTITKQQQEQPQQQQHNYLFGFSLITDAYYRDYSINAIYFDVCNRLIYDPCQALKKKDHVCPSSPSGTTIHQLVSAPHRIYDLPEHQRVLLPKWRKVVKEDIGGMFRMFKELGKHCTDFAVQISLDEEMILMKLLLGTAIDENWVRKMCKKLFGQRFDDIQSEIQKFDRVLRQRMTIESGNEHKKLYKEFQSNIRNVALSIYNRVEGNNHAGSYYCPILLDFSSKTDQKIWYVLKSIAENSFFQ